MSLWGMRVYVFFARSFYLAYLIRLPALVNELAATEVRNFDDKVLFSRYSFYFIPLAHKGIKFFDRFPVRIKRFFFDRL